MSSTPTDPRWGPSPAARRCGTSRSGTGASGVVTVVDYGVGNLRSVAKALEAAGAEVCVSAEAADLRRADRLVLPGVGAFAVGMANLLKTRLVDALTREVREERKPLL